MSEKKRNILLIGGGGREHSLAHKINQSPLLKKLHIERGNHAMAKTLGDAGVMMPEIHETFEDLIAYCKENEIDLVIVGPEAPLVGDIINGGIVDALRAENILAFGPTQKASQLEGSKIWMKQILQKYNIPTAKFACFDDADNAKQYVRAEYQNGNANQGKIVIKTDGLAAGKGVVIAEDLQSALTAIDEAIEGKFGSAGKSLVIEEFMAGEEFSWFAISDGSKAQFLGTAQDYKRVSDGDKGLNTGGMGAFSPARQESDALNQTIDETILQPLVKAMRQENIPYRGILFFGIMLTPTPKVIEINIRMGDPECQVILPRLQNDIISLFEQAAKGKLTDEVKLDDSVALTVVMAAKGYPQNYQKNSLIHGIGKAEAISENGVVYHAGTRLDSNGHYRTYGGRVLNITAINQKTLAGARDLAYKMVEEIKWDVGFCRKDIGL